LTGRSQRAANPRDSRRPVGPGSGGVRRPSPSTFALSTVVVLDHETAHRGECSVRLDGAPGCRAGATIGFAEAQTDPAALYLLSAWVRIDGTSAHELRTSARTTSVDAAGNVLNSDYRLCDPGPHDWRRYEWTVALPPATTHFNLVLFHHGEGAAWWDDVSLVRARPVAARAPRQDASAPDGKPVFSWGESVGKSTLMIAASPSFPREDTVVYDVTGSTFIVPKPLPTGRLYYWRVLTEDPKGELTMTVSPAEGERPAETSRFYAGTWEQRSADRRRKVEALAARLTDLQTLAKRNGMWDHFSLLGDALEASRQLLAKEPEDPAQALRGMETSWAELDYTVPWWNQLFLDDATLFADLNLDLPGLAAVKAAVAGGDFPAARVALLEYFRARTKPSWYGKHEGLSPRRATDKRDKEADQLLTHKHPIHDYKDPTFDLGPALDWHILPIIDIEWPTSLHRHFHWSKLAAAYTQTGNEEYAAELRQQLLDWAQDNPVERWDPERHRWAWSTLNATIRIYSSWIDSWLQIRQSPEWTADAQFVLLTCLREHGRFLMTHAARQGNWVVAEARGLVELGILFPEFREAEAWRNEGYRRLQHELAIQVLEDGVHIERTPGYHSMTMSCFMEPVRLGGLNGVDVPGFDDFVAKMEQMHEYYLYGTKPNHRMAQIGDAGPMNVDGQLRRGYDMFRRLDMQYVLTDGKEGEPPVHRSYAFTGAGQYVSRSAWCDPKALWSILDFGGHVGHCHEDTGHVSLYAYGTDLLIDTGRYSYAWPMRAPFYQTVGHNTVMVDGQTQKRRDALKAKWISTDQFDVFRGVHDDSEPLQHGRTLVFRQPGEAGPGYWLCVDRLTGKGQHRLDQRWHTTEKMQAKADGATITLTAKPDAGPQAALTLANLPQPDLKTEVVEGEVSYSWYEKIPVDVAQFTLEQALPAHFATVLYPTPPGAPAPTVRVAPAEASLDGAAPKPGEVTAHGRRASALLVSLEDRGRTFSDHWIVRHIPAGTVKSGELETDARVACVRREGDRCTSWLLTEGSFLRQAGQVLVSTKSAVTGAGATDLGVVTAAVCTGGEAVRVRAPAELTMNGSPSAGARNGDLVQLPTVAAPETPPVPREPGPIRFRIEPPPPPVQASTILGMLPADAAAPKLAARVEAEDFTGQGGGTVEVTAAKKAASGKSLLHWDNAGHWLEWATEVPEAGRYQLLVRACTAEVRALRKLTINGQTPPGTEAMEFASTGGFSGEADDWRTFLVAAPDGQPLVLELAKGKLTLRLENVDGDSLNLDWLGLARL